MKKEKSITLFIVDDNKIISMALESMIKETLTDYTISVYKLETGEECLSKMSVLTPDIIILDYHLSSNILALNGISVLKKIKSLNAKIEVIMLSGEDKLDVAVDSIKYGAHDYVIKNESAFVRMAQIVKNIAGTIHLKTNLKSYTVWNWVFGLAFAIIFITLFIIVHYRPI